MYGCVIQWVVTTTNTQETPSLFKRLWSQLRDFEQFSTIFKSTLLIAIGNDIVGNCGCNPRDKGQKFFGGGIQVYANKVNATFYSGIQLLFQQFLIYIMLILSYTNGLGINFHQFCKRIL